jgi:hypothetical protein
MKVQGAIPVDVNELYANVSSYNNKRVRVRGYLAYMEYDCGGLAGWYCGSGEDIFEWHEIAEHEKAARRRERYSRKVRIQSALCKGSRRRSCGARRPGREKSAPRIAK